MIKGGYKVFYNTIKGKHIDVGTLEDLRNANAYLLSH